MVLNQIKSTCLLFVLLATTFQIHSQNQPAKYWIKFKDKSGTPFSMDRPAEFLSTAAVNRRLNYNIKVDQTDLPVSPSYITAVEQVNHSRVVYASKWLNGVVIAIDSSVWINSVLNDIGALPFVSGSGKVHRYKTQNDDMPLGPNISNSNQRTSNSTSSNALIHFDYGGSGVQIRQLGLDCLHEAGYRGQGMTIAVMDAGFGNVNVNPVFDSLRTRNGILGTRDFVDGGNDVYSGNLHGSGVLSCMAAIKPGVIMGTAPRASYWLFRTEAGPETLIEEYNWIRAAEFADSVGADIITTSLGYTQFDDPAMNHTYQSLNGRTAPMSIAATMAARKGIFVLNSAGNEGNNPWHYISVPGDADSICTVGSVNGEGRVSAFSSVGPTSDGRIKPDLVARGEGTWITGAGEDAFSANGTSFSCPVMAGAVACAWQRNKHFNNIRILRNLKNNASNSLSPNNSIGWGIPNMCVPFDFIVYSNSESSNLTVELSETIFETISVQVIDLLGHVLFKEKIHPQDRAIVIDVPTVAQTIYLVKVETSAGTKTKKILKR